MMWKDDYVLPRDSAIMRQAIDACAGQDVPPTVTPAPPTVTPVPPTAVPPTSTPEPSNICVLVIIQNGTVESEIVECP